jgi:hypothetical protein
MKQQTINDKAVHVDSRLDKFNIHQKPSSTVEFFGHNDEGQVFVQFTNGNSYIYNNVHQRTIVEMNAAESIGKFIPRLKAYPYDKFRCRLVTPVEGEEKIR